MGFGISTPQQAWRVGELADEVVGSAILRLVEADRPARRVEEFVRSLRRGSEGRDE